MDAGSTDPILIAGAGIAGLATALALARHGFRSVILERQFQLTEAGAGIQLGPNAVRVLQGLGVAAALQQRVQQPEAVDVRSARTGRAIVQLPLGDWMADRHGAPYWTMRRADLQQVLLAAVLAEPAIVLRLGCPIAQLEACGGAGEPARVRTSVGQLLTAPAVIAADGLWSVCRSGISPGMAVRPSGRSAWRAMLPRTAVPPEFAGPNVGLWLGTDAHLVHYPVAEGRLVNVVAIAAETGPAGVSWSEPADTAQVRRRFSGWPDSVRQALAAEPMEGGTWRRWSLFEAAGSGDWHRGAALAIGDAAHPVLPFLAQGAALALEDAQAVAAAFAEAAAPAEAVAQVWARRRARAERVASAARRNGRLYHLSGPAAWIRDRGLSLIGGPRLMAQYDWLYGGAM